MKNKDVFGNDMAIVSPNRLLLGGVSLALFIATSYVSVYIINNVESSGGDLMWLLIFPIFFLFLAIILFACAGNKITFDDFGVSVEWRVKESRYISYTTGSVTLWKEIEGVDWQKEKGFVFFPVDVRTFWGPSKLLCLHTLMANRKRALKIAVEKLPGEKFTEAARNKLGEMGLLDLDRGR